MVLALTMFAGCASQFWQGSRALSLNEARRFVREDELYQARKVTAAFLQIHPKHAEAQVLMAQILNLEIARQKEVVEQKAPEEFTQAEVGNEISTWLERAESLLRLKQYDEALFAAEKVFVYEPDNQKASRLIDEIKSRAQEEGKADSLLVKQIWHGEIQIRIDQYEKQAENLISKKQWGAARLAVEKMLLLDPSHHRALELQKQIKLRHT